jgi:quinol monooxygenase YgiN
MILVTGSILAREDTFDEVLRLSLEHVERSRKEPGCISHAVHVDCQNPLRLFLLRTMGPMGRRCAPILPSLHRVSS